MRVPSEMIALGDAYVGGMSSVTSTKTPTPKFDVYESDGGFAREGVWATTVLTEPWGKVFSITKSSYSRHGGRLNMLFCDDHVEGMKVQTLFFSKDDRDLRLWNRDNEPHRERLSLSPH